MDERNAALRRVVDQVLTAGQARTPLDIRGGFTKAFYGELPRGIPLEMAALQGITSYEPTELVVTALAGTPLAQLEAVLAARGQCLPFEPPRFGAGGTVGGMVAAGLAGPARAGAGALRDHLLGSSVLNGRGEIHTFGGQVMKNVAGYDVSRLFAGSMGVLGVVCEVSLSVLPVPPACATLCFERDEAGALAQLNRWAGMPLPVSATSWVGDRLLVRMAGARAAIDEVRSGLGGTEMEPAAADLWWSDLRDQRHAFFHPTAAELAHGDCLWRVSVPDTARPVLPAGERWIEWGGAQQWLRSSAPAPAIRGAAERVGGHATLIRAADKSPGVFTPLAPPLLTIHRRLKQSFDPAGIFNVGRLYTEL